MDGKCFGLAVRDVNEPLARDLNVTLVGYVRGSTLNVYAGATRLRD